MLGSEILDVALGMVCIYLLLSLVASGVREAVETVVKARAVHLERGIREMLEDPDGTGFAQQVYSHPYVSSLFRNGYRSVVKRRMGHDMPTYIPARSFATALIDVVVRGGVSDAANDAVKDAVPGQRATSATATPALTVAALRNALPTIGNARLERVFALALDDAGDDMAKVQQHLEQWFNETMDRVSGWYRRRTQVGLLAIALAIALGMNVDSVALANHLWSSKSARAVLVAEAEALARDSVLVSARIDSGGRAALLQQDTQLLERLDLPIGWPSKTTTPWPIKLFGLLVTVFAISLGAPFWFDALKRIMVIRSTIKPGSADASAKGETSQGASTART